MRGNLWLIRRVFSGDLVIPFLLGSIALSVLGNAISQILTDLIGTRVDSTTGAALVVVLIAIVALAATAALVWRGLARRIGATTGFQHRQPEQRRGLILLVSRDEPCRVAIGYHRPALERCWLICSTQPQSFNTARKLIDEFPSIHFDEPKVIEDVNDPLEFLRAVGAIHQRLPDGWDSNDVIADFTGMTASGSVGVALACLSPPRPLEYTPAIYDEQIHALRSLQPIEIVLEAGLTIHPAVD